jgi:hypothetical protein
MKKILSLLAYGFLLITIWSICFLGAGMADSYTAVMGLAFTFLSAYFQLCRPGDGYRQDIQAHRLKLGERPPAMSVYNCDCVEDWRWCGEEIINVNGLCFSQVLSISTSYQSTFKFLINLFKLQCTYEKDFTVFFDFNPCSRCIRSNA